jgi:hypothetical protein
MAMVCPQCSTTHEQSLKCPTCGARLVYCDPTGTRRNRRLRSRWQQTPAGRIVVGLLLSQGLFYAIRHLLAGVVLTLPEESVSRHVFNPLQNLALVQTLQIVMLLLGSLLAGSGQQRGLILGTLVGLFNGMLMVVLQPAPGSGTGAEFFGQIITHTIFGALGGWIGMVIWKPLPIPTLPISLPIRKPGRAPRRPPLFAGSVAWFRVVVGTLLAIAGTLSASLVFQKVLEVSGGTLSTTDEMQDRFITWEIKALAILIGGALAGSTTSNGLKQGVYVGCATSLALIFLEIGLADRFVEMTILTLAGSFSLSVAGGWFGSQLFPPIIKVKHKSTLGPAALS